MYLLVYFLTIVILYVHICVSECGVCADAHGGRREGTGTLELESQAVVSYDEGDGNGTWVL